MKIVATADLHGTLPTIPECDLLLIAGDICPVWNHTIAFQAQWLHTAFCNWLLQVPANEIVVVWGNHDWIGERAPEAIPSLPCHILTDEYVEIDGYGIYGTPWQRRFLDWAFNLDEPELDKKYAAVRACDIIVSHGPPYGYGDFVDRKEHVGSRAFLQRIDEIKPKLAVFGHIHSNPGIWTRNGTILANVTLMNDFYAPMYGPRVFEV